MANHNFHFKETLTEDDIHREFKNQYSDEALDRLIRNNPSINTREEAVNFGMKVITTMLTSDTNAHILANKTDIPEQFNDLWLIYRFGDTDFASAFYEENLELAERVCEEIENELLSYCKSFKIRQNNPNFRSFEEDLQQCLDHLGFVFNPKRYCDIIRYRVAVECAMQARKSEDFGYAFAHYLDYFNDNDLEEKVYVGGVEGALEFLNKWKTDTVQETITVDNFLEIWWGDSGITAARVHGGEISINSL